MEFKKGDKVRRINEDFELAKVGMILTVSSVHTNGDIQVEEHLDATPNHLYAMQNFELVAEIAESVRPKKSTFTAGVTLRMLSDDEDGLFKTGDILTYKRSCSPGDIALTANGTEVYIATYDKFELAESSSWQIEPAHLEKLTDTLNSTAQQDSKLRKGDKFDSGKPQMRFLTKEFLEGTALAQTYGSKKYGPWNFQKGLEYSAMYDAAIRHMMAWFHTEATDPESGYSHLAHAAANLNMLMWMEANKPEMDDRPKQVSKELTEEEKYEAAKAIQERGR